MIDKSSNEYKDGYRAGVALMSACGRTGEPGLKKIARANALLDSVEVQNMLSKVACLLLEAGGEGGSLTHRLYSKLATLDEPLTKYARLRFIDPVATVLYEHSAQQQHDTGFNKMASFINSLTKAVGGALGTGHNITKNLMVAGGLTGAATGGLIWYLNRAATEDEFVAKAKEEQAKHYRRISKDLKKKIQLERDEEADETEKILKDQAPDAYVI